MAEDIDLLDAAESLAANSLLHAVAADPGEVRLSMLETIREFGLDQLASTGKLEAQRRRHAQYFLEQAEKAEPELWGRQPVPGTPGWTASTTTCGPRSSGV